MKIAIVGAGPAGLACACQLAKQGRQVSIFERMTDLSAQGSGVLIQPVGLLALDLLELRDSAERIGRKIRQIKGSSLPSGRATVSVDYRLLSGIDYALGIDRSAFWDLLYAMALSLGLEVHSGISIDKLHHYPDGRVSVSDINEQSYGPFDLVVDASGSNSVLDSYALEAANSKLLEYGSLWTKVNVSSEFRFNHDSMTLFSDVNNVGIGMLPTGRGQGQPHDGMTVFFNLKWQNWEPDKFLKWQDNALHQWPETQELINKILSPEQLYLAKFAQHTKSSPYGEKIVFIGDSAHASNPQLGQGINMSLVDSVCLPWALSQSNDVAEALVLYSKMRRSHVAIYQTLSRILTPFYQSDSRMAIDARDAIYPLLLKLGLVKRMTAKIISGQLGRPLKRVTC